MEEKQIANFLILNTNQINKNICDYLITAYIFEKKGVEVNISVVPIRTERDQFLYSTMLNYAIIYFINQ